MDVKQWTAGFFSGIKNWKFRTWFLLAVILALVITAVSILFHKASSIASAPVRRGEFIIDLYTSGEIEALNSTNVSVPRMRRHMMLQIVRMADEGTVVEAGDFLFQLDPSEAEQSVDQARDKLENAKAALASERASIESNMAQLKSQLESQRYSYQQTELNLKMMEFEAEAKRQEARLTLKKAEVSMKQAEQTIESQKIIDKATLMKAELNVKQAEADLRESEQNLSKLTITAPIGGLIVYKEIFSGGGMKKVQVGDTPFWGMPVIGIPDLSVMMAKTTINEVDISKIEKGQNAIVTIDALNNQTFYGHITRLAALARRENSTNAKVFDVEVQLDSTDSELRPGMTCGVRLISDRVSDALTVPLQSVFEKDGKTVVYIKSGRRAKLREVSVGRRSSDRIEILEGVTEGEEVYLRDPTLPLDELGGESESAPKPAKPKPNQNPGTGVSRTIIFG